VKSSILITPLEDYWNNISIPTNRSFQEKSNFLRKKEMFQPFLRKENVPAGDD